MTGELERQLRAEESGGQVLIRNIPILEHLVPSPDGRYSGFRQECFVVNNGAVTPEDLGAIPVGEIQIHESPWPTPELDAADRCAGCGQALGKRCDRDGCGGQIRKEDLQRALEPGRLMPLGKR